MLVWELNTPLMRKDVESRIYNSQGNLVFYRLTLYTLFISIILSGCSASKQQQISAISDKKPLSSTSKYKSQSGFYFVLIENNDDVWKIIDIKETPIERRAKKNQEILKVDESYGEVNPYFANMAAEHSSKIYTCNKIYDANIYSPCTSALVKAKDKGMLGFLKNFYSSSPIVKYTDRELIDKISRETNLFEMIERKKDIFAYIDCERSFRRASTIEEFNVVIEKCSSLKDATRILTLAIQNRDAMVERKRIEDEERRIQEEQSAKERELKNSIKLNQLEKETNMLEQMERRAMHNFTKNIENFRQSLKIGVETNCGKIIEMKNSAVKIQFPVKNYGDEHWIDVNKIFPKGHGCRFVKGNYIAPATF